MHRVRADHSFYNIPLFLLPSMSIEKNCGINNFSDENIYEKTFLRVYLKNIKHY